jgi:ribosome biogenesis GTPase
MTDGGAETLEGKIVKGVGGLYYVQTGRGVYICKARGLFRLHEQTPLVGDNVVISVVDESKGEGYLLELKERKNELIRPRAANVDVNIIVVSAAKPKINYELLDSLLIYSETLGLETAVCVNKTDAADEAVADEIRRVYESAKYRVFKVSAHKHTGIGELVDYMENRSVILSGPSGTGKTSLLNAIMPGHGFKTGELSRKTQRGSHTTRHAEFIRLNGNTFICDTPGFTSFNIASFLQTGYEQDGVALNDLRHYYPEFRGLNELCYYNNCLHISEHDCAVKEQVGKTIDKKRYERYAGFILCQS